MELGKLKVIKSKDYSTAKLLKFLREVEGFRPVLNGKALGGQQYTLFTIYFYPLSSIPFTLFVIPCLSSLSFHQPHRQYGGPKLSFRGASAPPISPLSPFIVSACRQAKKKERGKRAGVKETVIKRKRETTDALTERIDLSSPVSLLTQCETIHISIKDIRHCHILRVEGGNVAIRAAVPYLTLTFA